MSQRSAEPDTDAEIDDAGESTLRTRLAVLEEENTRLRNAYGQLRRTRYRRTALGLLALGALATLGGVVFADSRTVLFALGGTGLFAAVLTYYLTPEQFIAASVGEQVYAALAESRAEMTGELGLANVRVYVPLEDAGAPSARLFVPQRDDHEIGDVDRAFVTGDGRRRGLTFRPTGEGLYDEFRRALPGSPDSQPTELAEQLADAIVEQFELATAVRTEVDAAAGVAVFEITDSAFGRVDRFDHPISSLAAVGLAIGLDRPIEVETAPTDDEYRGDYLLTCRWEAGQQAPGDDGDHE